ncbi:MAG: aldo/keto reductase, partial [bacterium]|nr:aldo/keto reductase [bacterium]
GDAPPEQLVRYAMSLPVASAVIGMPKLQLLDANIQTAKSFQPMPKTEMKHLSDRLSLAKKASIDAFFRHHEDIC